MEPKVTILSLQPSLFLSLFLLLFSNVATSMTSKVSNGSIAECNEEIEMLMESEVSRRFLEEKQKYITPGALKPDQPVCDGGKRGEAYSRNGRCAPPPSNPEDRGCSAYYRCRGGS